ncbi:sugar nucleotide-binding protein, partial [Prochlorococcus sp. AH-736-L15]
MAYKKALIVGSNGMLGQAFVRQLKASNIEPIGIARSNANYCLDLINMEDLDKIIKESGSDFVINCAAIVSLKDCEDYPLMAKKINADLVNYLAKSCLNNSKKFIHISTDHYYLNDKKILHNEN